MADLKINKQSSNGSPNDLKVEERSSNNLMVDLDELRAKIETQRTKINETVQQIKIGKYTIEEIDGKLIISDGKVKFCINEMYEVLINHCEALKVLIKDKT